MNFSRDSRRYGQDSKWVPPENWSDEFQLSHSEPIGRMWHIHFVKTQRIRIYSIWFSVFIIL
jgi:hypothetical protein